MRRLKAAGAAIMLAVVCAWIPSTPLSSNTTIQPNIMTPIFQYSDVYVDCNWVVDVSVKPYKWIEYDISEPYCRAIDDNVYYFYDDNFPGVRIFGEVFVLDCVWKVLKVEPYLYRFPHYDPKPEFSEPVCVADTTFLDHDYL